MDAVIYFENYAQISEKDFKILLLIKVLGSSISVVATLFLIFLYIYLFTKTRCRGKRHQNLLELMMKKADNNANNANNAEIEEIADFSDENEQETSISKWRRLKKRKSNKLKIGLGNDLIIGYSISNLIYNSSNYLIWSYDAAGTKENPSIACLLQGALKTFGLLSIFSWTSSTAHCFLISIRLTNLKRIKYYAILYSLLSLILPTTFTIYCYLDNKYVFNGLYCGLEFDYSFVIEIILVLLCFSINAYCSITSRSYFKSRMEEIESDQTKKNESIIIRQYLMILWLTPTIMFIGIFTSIFKLIIHYTSSFSWVLIVYFEAITTLIFTITVPIIYIFYFRQVLKEFKCIKDEIKIETNIERLSEKSEVPEYIGA